MTLTVPELPAECDTLRAALLYAAAGWFVLPIDAAGKHAGSVLGKRWQDQTSRDPAQIAAWFAGTTHGLALHVGRSGAVAFDVDVPNAVPSVLAEAIKAAQPPHQSTRTSVPGRGHYLFEVAAGSVGNSLGDLPAGWGEIRGLNGIIVVQPTAHEKAADGGQYLWTGIGALPALPTGLGAMLRPPGSSAAPLGEPIVRDWVAGLSAGEPSAQVAAVPITMPLTGRHGEMNRRVMQLVRLAEQGHPGVPATLVALRDAFVAAVGEDRRHEFHRGLYGAVSEVLGNPTPSVNLPADLEELAQHWWERHNSDPFVEPAAVSDELVDETRPAEVSLAPVADLVDAMLGELLSARQVAELPNPVPVVAGLLYMDTLSWLIGKSGSFKSFVALDLAAHVASGVPWAGRRTISGPVLYIAAEGGGGMGLRVRAWESARGPMNGPLSFLRRPVQARGAEWAVLVELVRRTRPLLVIVDTQARVTVGIKENDNTEMGGFIEQADRLRRAAGSCVLLVHHIGRNGDDARGASAIDGAQDTELKVERVGGPKALKARLVVDKQKDGPDTDQIEFAMQPVDLGIDPGTGDPVNSLAAVAQQFVDPFPPAPWELEDVPARLSRILSTLHDQFSENGATGSQMLAILREKGWSGDYPKTTFYRCWNELQKTDRIAKIHGTQRWVVADMEQANA